MKSSKSLFIFGNCEGHFNGNDLQRSFKGDHFIIVKADGTILVHSMASGILPICHITNALTVGIEHYEGSDPAITFEARNQETVLEVTFNHIYSMVGIPEDNVTKLLKAAFDPQNEDDDLPDDAELPFCRDCKRDLNELNRWNSFLCRLCAYKLGLSDETEEPPNGDYPCCEHCPPNCIGYHYVPCGNPRRGHCTPLETDARQRYKEDFPEDFRQR